MKKILILAGGSDQIALIEQLREYFLGQVEIILIDQSANVRAISYADRFLPISTMDREAVLDVAHKEQVDYVLTACGDQPLSTMAYVSAKLGLPSYLSVQDVRDLTNKMYMKNKMLQCGIPTAKYYCINKVSNIEELKDLQYPLVVKPVDSNGSKGVKKVFSKQELLDSLCEAFAFSLSGDVIVEEFKDGEELSVDVYVEGTTAKLLSVTTSKKIKQNTDSFTIVQSYYPPQDEYNENIVMSIVQRIVAGFNLHDTPLLVQLIHDREDYNVIEFSARMGGGSKYKLIHTLSGVDIMKTYVDMVLGNNPHVEPHKKVNYAIMSYVYCTPGTFTSLKNFDKLKHDGIIQDYFVYKMPNSDITKSTTSSDRVAGFLVIGATQDEVQRKLKFANENMQVVDPNGVDIMKHDLY